MASTGPARHRLRTTIIAVAVVALGGAAAYSVSGNGSGGSTSASASGEPTMTVAIDALNVAEPGSPEAMRSTTTSRPRPKPTTPPTTTPPTTAPPAPTTTAAPVRAVGPGPGCHPSYDPCVPLASDVDCAGGAGNGPAYTGRVQVIGPDEYALDADGDGIGCDNS